VELVMRVSRGEDNRLTGTVRTTRDAGAREFSGTLELQRVFEELVPIERAGPQPEASGGDDQFHGATPYARTRETNHRIEELGG
jgi:hypothetical protein